MPDVGRHKNCMELIWVFDKTAGSNIGYPNLANIDAKPFTSTWHDFGKHWPGVIPFRFLMYLDHNHIFYKIEETRWAQKGWYPIGIEWFDFQIDYFSLIPEDTKNRVRQGLFKILFYYHEGDNPHRIHQRLNQLAACYGLENSFLFVSANTAADHNFDDHECFFRYVNRYQTPENKNPQEKKYNDFTLLSRSNKWWRLSCVADLWHENLLDSSIWSYDTLVKIIDNKEDNPISIGEIPEWENVIKKFIDNGPYHCDKADDLQKNDHHYVNQDLYSQSYFHIILETHFDADQSKGTFITEKTWKCIKYGQPFVLVGPPGSLQHLRDLGYRVFDSVLDNKYDQIDDPTLRWLEIKKLIKYIKSSGPRGLYQRCQTDVRWNQQWFQCRQSSALTPLIKLLSCN